MSNLPQTLRGKSNSPTLDALEQIAQELSGPGFENLLGENPAYIPPTPAGRDSSIPFTSLPFSKKCKLLP